MRGRQALQVVHCLGEGAAERGDAVRVRHHVDVVEGVEGKVVGGDELERGGALGGRGGCVVGTAKPGAVEGARPEHVGAGPAEAVPEAHGEAEVVLHALAEHDAVLVVPAVRQVVGRVRALVRDGLDRGEITVGHQSFSLGVTRG